MGTYLLLGTGSNSNRMEEKVKGKKIETVCRSHIKSHRWLTGDKDKYHFQLGKQQMSCLPTQIQLLLGKACIEQQTPQSECFS